VSSLLACGSESKAPSEAHSETPLPIEGIYDVRGITKRIGGGEERRISGTVILRQRDDRYTASFELDTTFPGVNEKLEADVIGIGEGDIDGRTLKGTAQMQLVVAAVPGIDTDFAYIPRIVGARIVSTSVSEIRPDGSLVIEIENRPAPNEDYLPTRTRLTGTRVADARTVTLPDVAAPPPE
jgi:hypothetical protein